MTKQTISQISGIQNEEYDKVTIATGANGTAVFESEDPMALMVVVCVAINNGADFVSGNATSVILRRDIP